MDSYRLMLGSTGALGGARTGDKRWRIMPLRAGALEAYESLMTDDYRSVGWISFPVVKS